ncbi:MAG TPA: NADH-quinone oxidoreductase subunit NuoG [Candidatus Acidoferrales bacterium]|jgi:NADH-quinone oxidoreductase subunit G|nr:NADH-quinone oxidoreductase subunit NuoG [Candidatus Acidoferrales bacterium]
MAEQKQVTFTLNGQRIVTPAGTLVIEAAKKQGVEVPSFCYYPGVTPSSVAACRMCLVEVEKMPKLQTACTLLATEGMVVKSDTDQVHKARKDMIEFLLSNHPLDCPVCDKGGECELQDMTFRYGLDHSRFTEEKLHYPEEKWSPLVYFDAPRCILCFRCVRVCDEGMDVKALGVGARGVHSVIIPNEPGQLACEECGMCIDVCPVGALTSGTYRYQTRPWEMQYVPNPCTHCSNGCKTTLSVRNNEILRANNRDPSGVNGEFLCGKGRFGFDFTSHAERVRQPMVRRNGKLEPASWEDALEEVARRLKQVRDKHGANAIGVIGSNHTTNEENYLLNRFARATLGTNHIDHHRSADYTGLAAALGPNAKTALATMSDVYTAPAVLLIGNDVTQQNPLVAWQIRSGVRHHQTRLYVINGQESKIHRQAKHLVKTAQGGERAAVRWLTHAEGTFDAPTSEALTQLKAALEAEKDVVILFGAEIQGAALRDLVSFAARIGGQTKIMALGDYANSRGAADMGVLPDRLPGYASLHDSGERARFGKVWGAEIPSAPGMTARAMMDAAVAGKLKALYVVGANPVKTFHVAEPDKLGRLELLVVHDLFLTETAQRADVVFPAASSYEKDGTLTNTAGEVQMTHRSIDPQGPRSDFDLIRILSHQLGMLGVGAPIRLRTPEAAFDEIRQNVTGYDLPVSSLLGGGAPPSAATCKAPEPSYDVPVGNIFSANDFLFTSGSLGRYCSKLTSTKEAKDTPWISSPNIQSWWYR